MVFSSLHKKQGQVMFKERMENLMGINLCVSVFNTHTNAWCVSSGAPLFWQEHRDGALSRYNHISCLSRVCQNPVSWNRCKFCVCLTCFGTCGADRLRCRERGSLCEVWAVGPPPASRSPHIQAGHSGSPTLTYTLRASPSRLMAVSVRAVKVTAARPEAGCPATFFK